MDAWATALLVVVAVAAAFLATMAYRGLLDAVEHVSSRCAECGKPTMLPVSPHHDHCWHCRHGGRRLTHPLLRHVLMHHR